MKKSLIPSTVAVALLLGGATLVATPDVVRAQGETETAAPAKQKVVLIELDGSYPDTKGGFDLFNEKSQSFADLLATFRRAKSDSEVHSIVLRIGAPGLGLSQAMELHEELLAFRASGKTIVATMDSGGLMAMLLSSAATEVIMPEVGSLSVMGLNADMYYLRDALALLGVRAEAVTVGSYKNAMETFTHSEMSATTQEQMMTLLEDILGELSRRVAEGRGVSAEQAREWIVNGPYTSKSAKDAGIVDELAYFDSITTKLRRTGDGEMLPLDTEYGSKPAEKKEPLNLFAMLMSGGKKKATKAGSADPKIAIVYATGAISDGRADKSNPFASSDGILSHDFIDLLDEVAKEPGLKAVVLRVNSPGGSAIASDTIWNRLEQFQASGIPVVASMGDVAASGGYYISMGADRIVAEPTTITGSIGVVGGKFILGRTMQILGINKQSISIGKNTGLFDETRAWTLEERAMIQEMMDDIYETFTAKTADGRGLSQDRIKELGGGRVWSGVAAKGSGLVDELGGLDRAIEIARELGKSQDAAVVRFPKEKTLSEMFEEILSGGFGAQATVTAPSLLQQVAAAAGVQVPESTMSYLEVMLQEMGGKPGAMLILPWQVEIR